MSDYRARIELLQEKMRQLQAAGAILAGTDQMRYLTGWKEGGHERFVGLLVPADGDPVFLVPAMNAPQARETPAGIEHVIGWDDSTGWLRQMEDLLGRWTDQPILIDDELQSGHLLDLQALSPGRKFLKAGQTMVRLREIKTATELAAMQTAADLIDSIFEATVTGLRAGLTEADVSDRVLAAIRERGSSPSFSPLICFGPNAALPHHHTGTRKLQTGDIVIIDIGCTADGYASDITRTIAFGTPSDAEAHNIYEIVFQAHHAARQAARPGVSGEFVDAAARRVITEAGYGPQFLHRTGHGIGLSTHEPPNIVAGNTGPLPPGTCFSVEPGIYLPGRFGVRIENIVTMTSEGARSLNAEPDRNLRVIG